MGLLYCVICFLCLLAVIPANTFDGNDAEEEDAIVVDAAHNTEEPSRQSKQIFFTLPEAELEPYDALFNSAEWRGSAASTGSCVTSKGANGKCMSFRQCYPYFKVPDINNWESWILGMYDTCSYYTVQGRQMFGVCCTNPIKTDASSPESSTPQPPDSENSTIIEGNLKKQYPNYPSWPPPIPTHPPDHTIPPLPTHPPSPGYPNLPQPTSKRPPAAAWPPTNKPPSNWPPTNKPPGSWPPPAGSWPPPAAGAPAGGRPPQKPIATTTSRPVPTAPPSAPVDASCGAKNGYQDQERIVGGHNADVGEWPWIAALFNGGRQFCGGSLIDSTHILSAAHCVAHMSSWDVARLTVRLGDHNIRTNSEVRHVEKKVKRIVRHRGFDSRTLYNDIAILTLDSPVQFSQQIRPVCLPGASSDYTGRTATVIGWGSLRESGPQPAVLQEVNIPIWSNSDCRNKYGPAAPGGIVEHMLCAGQASRDSCSGDSGGPLMINAGRWTQVGIVSWGIGCGKGQYPGVYTRVEKFLPWIYKNLK